MLIQVRISMNITTIVFWHGRGAEQYEIKQHLIRTVINSSLFYVGLDPDNTKDKVISCNICFLFGLWEQICYH